VDGGFIPLMNACFKPGEFVSVSHAFEDDDGHPVPRGGTTLTATRWIEHARDRGGIDKVYTGKLGLYIRINPLRQDGSKNDDVTSFRHCLVEFDKDGQDQPIPKEKQLGAILSSGLPVSALIDSGNKSLHAWVRVEAPDATEYKRRVEVVWSLFSDLFLDKQNKNPSRFSRCPDGWRTVDGTPRQQKLLALGLGANSWEEWEAQAEDESLDPMPLETLGCYDTDNDPNTLLGKRWLCKRGSLVIVGQSGIGKSSLCMQLMLSWALGLPAFNIAPVRPLKSLLIQAENDIGDLAEMFQGVTRGMASSGIPCTAALLGKNVVIYRDTTRVGAEFALLAERLILKHRPDLIWCDPLLNYIGDDLSLQKVVADFCCVLLNAIAKRTGVAWVLLHHTGKPAKDGKASAHWTASDLAYSGLGSSALVNWSRETAVLTRCKTPEGMPPTFQWTMTKRRKRAGLLTPAGEPAESIFLQHSPCSGIHWVQCEEPPQPEEKSRPKGSIYTLKPTPLTTGEFQAALALLPEGKLTREHAPAMAEKFKVSERTLWNWVKKLATRSAVSSTAQNISEPQDR